MNNKKYTFYIEITNACNLSCNFCPSSDVNNHKAMSYNDFINIINNIKDYISLVYFHVLGEPMLHPNFLEILDYCEKEKIDFAITTNGTLIDRYQNAIFSFKHLKKINISLQSLIQFDEIKRSRYLNNLDNFLEERKNIGCLIPINLRLWNDKTDVDVKVLNSRIINLFNNIEDIYQNVRISQADNFKWPSLDDDVNLTKTGCLGGKKQFAILNDGTIALCCLDYLGKTKIGNLLTDSFSLVIKKDEYIKSIDGFNNRQPYFELCKKCTYRNRFNK